MDRDSHKFVGMESNFVQSELVKTGLISFFFFNSLQYQQCADAKLEFGFLSVKNDRSFLDYWFARNKIVKDFLFLMSNFPGR